MTAAPIALGAPGAPTAWAAVAVAVLMAALWVLSIRIRDVSIADPAWGPAFVSSPWSWRSPATAALGGAGCSRR